jgi:ankyrin repeat protein
VLPPPSRWLAGWLGSYCACYFGHASVARELLAMRADVGLAMEDGCQPVHAAARVRRLLTRRACNA